MSYRTLFIVLTVTNFIVAIANFAVGNHGVAIVNFAVAILMAYMALNAEEDV